MPIINLLYKQEYPVNDKIRIEIPTVGQILESEESYYSQVMALTAMPIDMMVQLDDLGIDFTTLNEFDLFLLMFRGIQSQDTHLIFGDLDLRKFSLARREPSNDIVLVNTEDDIVIDKGVQAKISSTLRKIHHLEKNKRKPGNEEAKQYMLERARKKLKRNKTKSNMSQLEGLIVALVNTEQFKYNFETVKALTIYQFNESLQQIISKIEYDNKMFGVYTGNIRAKDLTQDDLNWLSHK